MLKQDYLNFYLVYYIIMLKLVYKYHTYKD